MWKKFKQDAQRWVEPQQIASHSEVTFFVLIKLLYRYLPLRAMLLFRVGSWFKEKRIPFFPSFCQRRLYTWYGLEMVIGQEVGGGLYIAHPVGTVISVSRMGENCSVIASVTVGMRNEWAFPTIGDNVFIGSGARILGDITVGNDAVIGANAVVIKDVPRGATAVGIPAKVIRKKPQVQQFESVYQEIL